MAVEVREKTVMSTFYDLETEPKRIEIVRVGGVEMTLQHHSDVWSPAKPTFDFLETLSRPEIIEESIKGKRVLVVGTGTGIEGIYCLLRGASYVLMTDINPAALELSRVNVQHNEPQISFINDHCNGRYPHYVGYAIAQSDVFNGFVTPVAVYSNDVDEQPEMWTFDTIIANPPAQPQFFAHPESKAASYNETLEDGRYVHDLLIRDSRIRLSPFGSLYMLTHWRQGFGKTSLLLDSHWGRENWFLLAEREYKMNPDYVGPYMQFWIDQQGKDGDTRVYAKKLGGGPETFDPGIDWYSRSSVIRAVNIV